MKRKTTKSFEIAAILRTWRRRSIKRLVRRQRHRLTHLFKASSMLSCKWIEGILKRNSCCDPNRLLLRLRAEHLSTWLSGGQDLWRKSAIAPSIAIAFLKPFKSLVLLVGANLMFLRMITSVFGYLLEACASGTKMKLSIFDSAVSVNRLSSLSEISSNCKSFLCVIASSFVFAPVFSMTIETTRSLMPGGFFSSAGNSEEIVFIISALMGVWEVWQYFVLVRDDLSVREWRNSLSVLNLMYPLSFTSITRSLSEEKLLSLALVASLLKLHSMGFPSRSTRFLFLCCCTFPSPVFASTRLYLFSSMYL